MGVLADLMAGGNQLGELDKPSTLGGNFWEIQVSASNHLSGENFHRQHQDWHSPGKYSPPSDQLLSARLCVSWFGAGWWIAGTLGDTFDSHEQRDPAIKTSLAPTLLIKIRWRLERNCWAPFHVWEWSKVWFIHESENGLAQLLDSECILVL